MAVCLTVDAAGAHAAPYIHAHRGGSIATSGGDQVPVHPENSLPAFRAVANAGFVIELDVKLTSDARPVVIHDDTLDRTTNCDGTVGSYTLARLRSECELDLLGTSGASAQLPPGDQRRTRIPTMEEALALAKRKGVEVNLEIKNLPTDSDFDPGVPPAYAETIAARIKASRFPPSQLIVQSFLPANIDVIEADPYFERARTSFLTLGPTNDGGPSTADARGYDLISPQWPVSAAYIAEAHGLGLGIVPYTLDDAADIRAAANAGVDAVISNDPGLARKVIAAAEPPAAPIPPPPSRAECRRSEASRAIAPITSYDRPNQRGAIRVFAMQFKQELRHVVDYDDFRTKIECMIRRYVTSREAKRSPNVIAFNEDVGLMTLATGSRGAAARATFENPGAAPGCAGAPAPCGVGVALGEIAAGYSKEIAAYTSRYPDIPPLGAAFVAGTDTFARGWMQVFSDMARRYDVYILGSNNQAPFRESRDPSEILTFADPDHPRPESVYVATGPFAYNEVFMWAPDDVRKEGPRPLRNVVTSNQKVPVTPIEEIIQIQPGPSVGPDAIENLRPYRVPKTKARLGFATSLPAFIYGYDIGEGGPQSPCADVSSTYMSCLDKLRTNVVIQDEANPGPWAAASGEGNYQPLEWMRSTWRAVADPEVRFKYNVTPHMVGNLADLAFDGQTAITQRQRGREVRSSVVAGGSCTYVGNTDLVPGAPENDPDYLAPYAGKKTEFLAIAPWVVADGPRAKLRTTSDKLAPGSGDELENDYVETAVIADLTFPIDDARNRCAGVVPADDGGCRNSVLGTGDADRLRGSRKGDRIRGRGGDDRLLGGRGDDCLQAGGGDDVLRGGPGRDLLRGGPGRDRIHCGKGRDTVIRGPGDRVRGRCERIR